MKISYFRKSTFDLEKTLENVKKEAKSKGLKVVGEIDLPNENGKAITLCDPTWLGNLVASDVNLIGLLPCLVVVYRKDDEVRVGVGSADVLGSVSRNPAVVQIATDVEKIMKDLVNSSAGVGPLKPINIKLYSTTTCPYCKMEKSWLESNGIKHEVVYVDIDQSEAEKMVQKTGQMGVPVTEIQYDDSEEFVVGFDKAKLSDILGI
jgi:glutaredoxin 3